MKKLFALFLIIVLTMVIFNITCSDSNWDPALSAEATFQPAMPSPTPIPPKFADMLAVGDIMCHYSQVTGHFNGTKYDFRRDYRYVKGIIRSADLALCNFETTLGKGISPYSGYPRFNSPDELADAIKFAGFDILSTANNHSYDTGGPGFLRTLQILKSKSLTVIGTRNSKAKNFTVKNVNGIQIGLTNYTYETDPSPNAKALNGIPLAPEHDPLINTFHPSTLNEDLKEMKHTIKGMKNAGAEAIVFYIHWGNEYQTTHSSVQETIAKELSKAGVDVIFGTHPHVLQDWEIIKRPNGKSTYVFYSLGNFISNMDTPLTQDGIIAKVRIKKYKGKVTVVSSKLIPTMTHRYYGAKGLNWDILPIKKAISQPKKFRLKDTAFLKSSLSRTMSIIKSLY